MRIHNRTTIHAYVDPLHLTVFLSSYQSSEPDVSIIYPTFPEKVIDQSKKRVHLLPPARNYSPKNTAFHPKLQTYVQSTCISVHFIYINQKTPKLQAIKNQKKLWKRGRFFFPLAFSVQLPHQVAKAALRETCKGMVDPCTVPSCRSLIVNAVSVGCLQGVWSNTVRHVFIYCIWGVVLEILLQLQNKPKSH